MTGARKTIAVMITFSKFNKNSLERRGWRLLVKQEKKDALYNPSVLERELRKLYGQ